MTDARGLVSTFENNPPRSGGHRSALSRRAFLGGGAAALGAAASGCVASTRSANLDLRAEDFGDIRIVNWPEYIDPDLIEPIAAAANLRVSYDEVYNDNVSGWDELIAPYLGATAIPPYSLIVPTNWVASRLVGLGELQPIPLEVVPNHVNIDPAFLTMGWDRGARFHMPWQAGITGIAYDPARTGREITSVADLFDPAFAGRVGGIVEMREAIGLAMLANGDDPSRPTRATADRGFDRIEQSVASGQFGAWTANEFSDMLAAGELDIAMAWSGDVVQLQADRPDIKFVIPDEGAIQWFDTMVIPAGRSNSEIAAAGRWMNEVYNPTTAASITEWVQYISPVLGVREELLARGGESEALATNPILFPDDATKRRLYTWGSLSADDENELDARFNVLIA